MGRPSASAYDARIFGVFSHDALALCHFRLGHVEESARYYALAAAAEPENPDRRIRHQLATARLSRQA